ncbi:hypothetical protein H7J51_25430 [Mycobacterium crocinum]|uniref:Molecular chaperone n=1 Tax=Mycolicibacterium crocinum TaxID=388459 RepID=A0ABY3TUX0_9MYCO|nr:hypothetical protein [Mycolicibacterium crocinum]MCV7218606.1 hypothetical protein [Mycolicibacterium crocinum]ULN43898.1 hypothetical protein MI149_13015 [Mycolicibacterium crocinum]
MTEPLGISVGTTSLVAARPGAAAVIWPAEVTIGDHLWTNFVDRVGDPTPLTHEGFAYRAEQLLAAALSGLADAEGSGLAAVSGVAVPAHWGPGRRDALRDALWNLPALASAAAPPVLVSDAAAALRSLQTGAGLPRHGVVVVCDFAPDGTSVTLADGAADYRQIGETVRFAELSGGGQEVLQALDGALDRARVARGDISAVAAVGEGATTAVVQQLSDHLHMQVTVSAHPHLDAALGASLAAARQLAADAPTGMAPAPLIADVGPQSATMAAALAWSNDEAPVESGGYEQTYAYGDYDYRGYGDEDDDLSILGDEPATKRGSGLARSVPLLLGGAAAVAAVAVGGFAYTLTGTSTPDTPSVKPLPATAVTSVVSSPSPAPPTAETATVTNPPVQTVTEQAPPPQTPTTVVTTTTTTPPTTTTTTTSTTTTTTTTTTPTTTTTTPTTTTTVPTTTTEWDTTTTRRPLIPGLPPPPRIPGLPPMPNLNVAP